MKLTTSLNTLSQLKVTDLWRNKLELSKLFSIGNIANDQLGGENVCDENACGKGVASKTTGCDLQRWCLEPTL